MNKNRNTFIYIFILSILFNFVILIYIADATDCSTCHTDTGKPIKAKDTVEISGSTCLKCHDPDYPPTPIGYNTHLVHIGKYSASVDYLKRHPGGTQSLDCNSCHTQIIDCQSCHTKGLPHIKPPLGNNCNGCHGTIDKLFRHPAINLQIHNLFNLSDNKACTICHNPENMRSLKLASGEIVPIQESHRLCYQCHSGYYNLWDNSSHYSNKTVPNNKNFNMMQELRVSWENKWRKDNTCASCHNPHNPSELYQLPIKNMEKIDVSIISILSKYYLYILGIIVGIVAIILVMAHRRGIDVKKEILLKLSKLSELKLSDIKLPKISIPKISIPISISTEELKDEEKSGRIDESEKVKEYEKSDGKLDERADETKPKNKNRILSILSNKDVLFILSIVTMLSIFYITFGAFLPIVVAISESMSPHMERGDMIFYNDMSKVDNIKTYNSEKNINGYKSFGNYGDVILYKPFGKEGVTPYIHRAMYYVEKGKEMWPGGPKAPHAGYITKGDNVVTNKKYDQQLDLSLNQPVKKEWIIATASFRIPYVGYIRLILP